MPKNSIQHKKDMLRTPKIISLTKQQYQLYHKVRDLCNWTFGEHTLLSKDHKKYIMKTIPYLSSTPSKQPFLTTHPQHYFQFTTNTNKLNKCRSYIFPLIGQPLSTLKQEQRWGPHIKNWVQKCGNVQNCLIDILRIVVNNYLNHNIGDILIECYRILDGQIVYVYDNWMNSTLDILKSGQVDNIRLNLQDFYLSQAQIQVLKTKNNQNKKVQIRLNDFCKKLCLLLISFGVPELKTRNYKLGQFTYHQANIQQKIKFFKTKYTNKHLIDIIDKLWQQDHLVINDIWKMLDTLQPKKAQNLKSNTNSTKNKLSLSKKQFFNISNHNSSLQLNNTILCENKQNKMASSKKINPRIYLQEQNYKNSINKMNIDRSYENVTSGCSSTLSKKKLRLRDNYQSLNLSTSCNSQSIKIKDESFIQTKFKQNDKLNLKKILIQSIQYHTSSWDFSDQNFPILKLVQYLGLNQYVPVNLYEQSVVKTCEEISVMSDWVCQQYPNGAIYFGQTLKQDQQTQIKSSFVRNGKGLYLFDSNDLYIGTWINNSMDGEGVYIFKSGQIYKGELKNGLKNGLGCFQYADKRIYEGYWKQNTKFGMGTVYFPNQVKFFGFFRKGKNTQGIFTKIVRGQIVRNAGCLQNYNWQQQKFNKNLQIKTASHSKIQKCQVSRYMTMTDQNGNNYIGQGYDNKKHGFGILDGKQQFYEGVWKDDNEHGDGKLVVKGKFEVEGIWQNGMLVKMYA